MRLLFNICLGLIWLGISNASAQDKYWVFFTDKSGVDFDPSTYFDSKAIERRIKHKIDLYDITDFPLNSSYVNNVEEIVESVGFRSRWFNAVVVVADHSQMKQVKELPCVKHVKAMDLIPVLAEHKTSSISKKTDFDFYLDKQIKSLQGQLFEGQNIRGKGVRVAVFDGGFPNVDTDTAFAHIRTANRIIDTYDFTKNKTDVYCSNTHGTMVLSNIAGVYKGRAMGVATDAEFLLAKTEVGAEPFAEEEYWLAAMEWADKNGADIINSSLGYTHHRYFREQMDGSSLVAKAGNMAFEKGILVVNSAGNEGSSNFWKYIGTPADADSVLSIGGIDPYTDYHISFSSYGPTADGRMKPNVSAMGQTLVISKNGPTVASGTSFSSPLVAGFAACVLEMNPDYTVSELFEHIQRSANLYPYYDYAHGYGMPQASYFTSKRKQATVTTFRFEVSEEGILSVKLLNHSNHPNGQKNYMYYHIADKNGKLKAYELIDVYQQDALDIDIKTYEPGDVLRVYYQSYTSEYTIK
jgi:subtilisin family serine protease